MSSWLEKLIGGISTTTSVSPVVAVTAAPGWNVIGTFPLAKDVSVRMDVIASVSDLALTMSVRLYCISPGAIGAVTGSLVLLSSVIDVEAFSGVFKLPGNLLYQVQAQVVGAAGDNYFGQVRRASPVAPS